MNTTTCRRRRFPFRMLVTFGFSALPWICHAQASDAKQEALGTNRHFTVQSIGRVEKSGQGASIVLDQRFQPGLLGLDGFSHVWVFWWFDRNDTPAQRAILQVHPRGNRQNPLTGVFATRAPVRPNLIAMSLCKIKAVKENVVEVESIDAFPGTPVLDLKPYATGIDSAAATGPDWARRGAPSAARAGDQQP